MVERRMEMVSTFTVVAISEVYISFVSLLAFCLW